MAGKTIGVLAMQGAFIEHEQSLKKCGVDPVEVKFIQDLDRIDGLIIPGGESTTIGKLMNTFGLDEAIKEKAVQGMPIWGTCAGMILMAKEIESSDQLRLGFMDMLVERNAFGRQVDSFEADLKVEGIGNTRGVFIRAPYASRVWGKAQVLSRYQDKIVMVKQDNFLATAFHPELTKDLKIHRLFIDML
ncbi:pyridoxal 5'-phosphate synthase glutaminase subunit PdxT [Syntrophomonas erecta]